MTDNTTKYESLSFYEELFAKLNAVIYTLNLKTQTYGVPKDILIFSDILITK